MGFITRAMVPRSVRRAVHPVRAARRAVTPRSVKRVSRAVSIARNPFSAGMYSIEKDIRRLYRNASSSSGSSSPVYTHGSCSVNHRTWEAAQRCGGGGYYSAPAKQSKQPKQPKRPKRPAAIQKDQDFIMKTIGGIVVTGAETSFAQLVGIMNAIGKLHTMSPRKRNLHPFVWSHTHAMVDQLATMFPGVLTEHGMVKAEAGTKGMGRATTQAWTCLESILDDSDCMTVGETGEDIRIMRKPDVQCSWWPRSSYDPTKR